MSFANESGRTGPVPSATSLITESISAYSSTAEIKGSSLSFHDISARVRRRGGVLLGWRRSTPGVHNDDHGIQDITRRGRPLVLNPASKSKTLSWSENDQLVVLTCKLTDHYNCGKGKSHIKNIAAQFFTFEQIMHVSPID